MEIISANELLNRLHKSGILSAKGEIVMSLNNVKVTIKTTDTIGNNIQEWLKAWMEKNQIYYSVPSNTQKFPDFFLSDNKNRNLLEVKSYLASRRPAFDVANFDSYCESLREHPYRINADYLIFAYALDNGVLSIRRMYLKKVWEITGKAGEYPLNCQRKKGQIYNIRLSTSQN